MPELPRPATLVDIRRAAGIGGACDLDREVGNQPLTRTQIGFGEIYGDLPGQLIVSSRSTEGFGVAGRSMHTTIEGRRHQRGDLFFTRGQAIATTEHRVA